MIISSMELNKQPSKGDILLPRYRSMKMNINDESKENESANRSRAKGNGSGLGAEQPSSARIEGSRGPANANGGKAGSASKRDQNFGGNSNSQASHQPR